MIKSILLFIAYVITSSWGLYKIKTSISYFDQDFIYGFTLYGTGFIIWYVILKSHPLSVAFPVAASSLIIATQVIGFALLNEPLKNTKILGIVLIIIGIALIYFNRELS